MNTECLIDKVLNANIDDELQKVIDKAKHGRLDEVDIELDDAKFWHDYDA